LAFRKPVLFYSCAAGVVIVDQLTKVIVRGVLADGRPVTVVPHVLDLRLHLNPGASFGIGSGWAPLFAIIAVVAAIAIVKLRSAGPDSRTLSIGLGLLLGGALGNLIDRLTSSDHAVTDFLDMHIWPVFNLADAAIVVGALMTFFYVYVVQKRGEGVGH